MIEIDHPPDIAHNLKTNPHVANVERDILHASALPMDRTADAVVPKDTMQNVASLRIQGIQETQRNVFSRKDTWEVSLEGPDDFEFEEDAIQIVFSKDSFHNNKHGQSSNIMFDEIEQTKALGDLLLSNKAGLRYTVRFKLDSGAGANLLPIGMYKKLFPDRKLNGTADKRIQLIAANKTRIKQ